MCQIEILPFCEAAFHRDVEIGFSAVKVGLFQVCSVWKPSLLTLL